MVGKWLKCNGPSYEQFTENKWYKVKKVYSDNIEVYDNFGKLKVAVTHPYSYFDLSNPMDYNPDEVKEEEKPKLEVCDSITIEISSDGKVSIKSTLSRFETIYLLKKVTESEIDKINKE